MCDKNRLVAIDGQRGAVERLAIVPDHGGKFQLLFIFSLLNIFVLMLSYETHQVPNEMQAQNFHRFCVLPVFEGFYAEVVNLGFLL